MSEDPYVAPAAEPLPLSAEEITAEQALEIRKIHIKHEGSIRSIGILYYLGGPLFLIGGVMGLVSTFHLYSLQEDAGADVAAFAGLIGQVLIAVVVTFVLGIGAIIAARGIRSLKRWGRILGIIISTVGLLAFPIGTLINAYILLILIVPKASMIFSPLYQKVIALTPEVKCKTSKALWIILGSLALLLIWAFFSPSSIGSARDIR